MGSVQSYDTAHGKRYRVAFRTPDRRQTVKRGFRTKREAEQYLATIEVSKMRGEWIDATRARASFADVARVWFDAQVQVKPTTLSGYRHSLDKHVLPRWGGTAVADISHGDVQEWVRKLNESLGPSMVRQVFLVLSGVLKFAIRDGRLTKNPCDDIQLPRIVKKKRGYLTHSQVRALATQCGTHGDIVLFLSYTGLRWGEMAGLKVQRLDVVRRRVNVVEAVSEPRGAITWGTPKNHESRSVPIPEFVMTLVLERCTGKGRDSLIFAGADGGVLRSGNFRRRVFDSAVKRAMDVDPTFPRVTVHDLRHTAASLAVSAGANVKAVQRMLGHASAAMTLDVYADLFDDDLDAVANALNDQASK